MATAIRSDGQGGYLLSKGLLWLFAMIMPMVSAGVGIVATNWAGDLLRDREVTYVQRDVARLVGANAKQIDELVQRWQEEHDLIAAVKAEVGELGRRGAALTLRRDQQLEGVDRRLVTLEGAIGDIRAELSAINVRLDLLLGRDGQRLREGMTSPPGGRQPASSAG